FEVMSPGSYPLGVTPDNLVHTPRNTHLMEALRHLNFVRMAEEGVKTMRDAMRAAGLPDLVFSPANLDRVTVTLLNSIGERQRKMGGAARSKGAPLTLLTNIFPLRIVAPFPFDPNAPFAAESGRPSFGAVRSGLISALRGGGYQVDSFAGTSAVDFTEEHI